MGLVFKPMPSRRKKRQAGRMLKRKGEPYRTNRDTVGLNTEQFGPGPAPWEKPVDPRLLRKRGSQTCR